VDADQARLVAARHRKGGLSCLYSHAGLTDVVGAPGDASDAAAIGNIIDWGPGQRYGVVPAGVQAARLGETALLDDETADLVASLGQFADLTILIALPLHNSVNAQILASHATSSVLVVHMGFDRTVEITEALAELAEVGTVLRGTALMRQRSAPTAPASASSGRCCASRTCRPRRSPPRR